MEVLDKIQIPDTRLKLDSISGVEIYIEPCKQGEIEHQTLYMGSEHILVQFRVVTETGSAFQITDLTRMCLNKNEICLIENLCKRRLHFISTNYLPSGVVPSRFHPVTCKIEESGLINISFFISGSFRNVS